ncbi:MAG: hypothetical protein ACP5M9_01690 [Candidatus Micrarchaeia archaeon]
MDINSFLNAFRTNKRTYKSIEEKIKNLFNFDSSFLAYMYFLVYSKSSAIFIIEENEKIDFSETLILRMLPKHLPTFLFEEKIPFSYFPYFISGMLTQSNYNYTQIHGLDSMVVLSRPMSMTSYKNNEKIFLSGIQSFIFLNSDISKDEFIKKHINKKSVHLGINKIDCIIKISRTDIKIYEFSWLSKGEISAETNLFDLDMFNCKEITPLETLTTDSSNILKKYTYLFGESPECTAFLFNRVKSTFYDQKLKDLDMNISDYLNNMLFDNSKS